MSMSRKMNWDEMSPDEQTKAYQAFHKTYREATGESWDQPTFAHKARSWTFWGTPDGFVTTRWQKRFKAHKITGAAGSDRGKHVGMKHLLSQNEPVWTAAHPDIVSGMEKHYGLTPLTSDEASQVAVMLHSSGMLGDWNLEHIDDEGNMHLRHPSFANPAVKRIAVNDHARQKVLGLKMASAFMGGLSKFRKGIDPGYNSPIYEALNGYSPFGSRSKSAWILPDGSHEVVHSHASSVIGTGETLHQYQKRTGKVRVGLDMSGAYAGFVHSLTPHQQKVVNEFLKTALLHDYEPSWERQDLEIPSKFDYKTTLRIPSTYVDQVHKSEDDNYWDLLKARETPIPEPYRLPKGMAEGTPEHESYLKTLSFDENSPHPEDHGKRYTYSSLGNVYKDHPHLEQEFGHLPQNLWHSDQALLDMMERGKGGQHWYGGYNEGLKKAAVASGIAPSMLSKLFALNGQSAGLKENIEGMLKELSRHRAGYYTSPNKHKTLFDLGIRKASSGKPSPLQTILDALVDKGVDSKKLAAYKKSIMDHMTSNPAIDMWIQRAMIGTGESAQSDTVSPHVTIAATGRINHLVKTWNNLHPDNPVNAAQTQAMLWYGMKHSAGDHLENIKNQLVMRHPDVADKHTKRLSADKEKISYDGDFSQTGSHFQLDHPEGLPLSKVHKIQLGIEPQLQKLYENGVVHTDNYNWHKLGDDHSDEEVSQALSDLKDHHSKYSRVKVKDRHIYIPKRSLAAISELMNQSGVTFDPTRNNKLNGTSETILDEDKFHKELAQDPYLHEALATIHATIKAHKDHPLHNVIGDVGHGTVLLASSAYKYKKMPPLEQPLEYGQYK